jgi:hypothetical protein
MLDLANRFWDWKAVQLETQRIRTEEKERLKLARKKYGPYMDKAKNTSANYSPNIKLDKYFEDCIESGIQDVNLSEHYCKATFGNGWKVEFWIANKMYGYCSNNTKFFTDTGKVEAFHSNTMPSMYMCYYIQDKIENFSKSS